MLLEAMKDTSKLLTRTLLFGLLLLFTHLLRIEPSTVDAGGVKFNVPDAIVIQGSLAVLFLFSLWSYIYTFIVSEYLSPFDPNKLQLRSLVRSGRKAFRNAKTKRMERRDPKQVKRRVWWLMLLYNFFFVPVVLIVLATVLVCLLVAIPDVVSFADYLWSRPWGEIV